MVWKYKALKNYFSIYNLILSNYVKNTLLCLHGIEIQIKSLKKKKTYENLLKLLKTFHFYISGVLVGIKIQSIQERFLSKFVKYVIKIYFLHNKKKTTSIF